MAERSDRGDDAAGQIRTVVPRPPARAVYRWDTRSWWRRTPNGLVEDRSIKAPAPKL